MKLHVSIGVPVTQDGNVSKRYVSFRLEEASQDDAAMFTRFGFPVIAFDPGSATDSASVWKGTPVIVLFVSPTDAAHHAERIATQFKAEIDRLRERWNSGGFKNSIVVEA